MSLTITEKQHWKDRINRKIETAIEELFAKHDPSFLDRVRKRARAMALESLGIHNHQARLDAISEERQKLCDEEQLIRKQMVAAIDGTPVEQVNYYHRSAVDSSVLKRQRVHEKEILAADPLGQKILAYRQEQEELLDTVWLATSGKQIKELWSRVGDVLGQTPSPFQKHALQIQPPEDS